MKVWVVEFFPEDMSDGNGVFSSYEKARAYFDEECERCSDIWHNFTICEGCTASGESYAVYATWEVVVRDETSECHAFIYETEVDFLSK